MPDDSPFEPSPSVHETYDDGMADRLAPNCRFNPGDPVTASVGAGAPVLTGVQHVVVITRENHSFDYYFGSYPPAPGQTIEAARPDASNPDPLTHQPVYRYHETRRCIVDTNHEWSDVHLQIDDGRMDGFVADNNPGGGRAMGHYNREDIPFYWWLADHFALSDHNYAALPGPTHPNLMYYYHATSCGYTDGLPENPLPSLNCGVSAKSIFDLLKDKGVSAAVYSTNNFPLGEAGAGVIYGAYRGLVGTMDDFGAAVATNNLAQVVYVEPTYKPQLGTQDDEHPPTNAALGHNLSYQVIKTLMNKPEVWKSTVVFITWDEHGGYYDHVDPPSACPPDDASQSDNLDFKFDKYGLRVPLLVASPMVKKGYVSHYTTDHSSILRFIEHVYGLGALTKRDANAWPLLDMFDLSGATNDAIADDSLLIASPVPCASDGGDNGVPEGWMP